MMPDTLALEEALPSLAQKYKLDEAALREMTQQYEETFAPHLVKMRQYYQPNWVRHAHATARELRKALKAWDSSGAHQLALYRLGREDHNLGTVLRAWIEHLDRIAEEYRPSNGWVGALAVTKDGSVHTGVLREVICLAREAYKAGGGDMRRGNSGIRRNGDDAPANDLTWFVLDVAKLLYPGVEVEDLETYSKPKQRPRKRPKRKPPRRREGLPA